MQVRPYLIQTGDGRVCVTSMATIYASYSAKRLPWCWRRPGATRNSHFGIKNPALIVHEMDSSL